MALTLEPQVRQAIERRCRQTHDKRIAQRLYAVLWVAGGRAQGEVADLLGVTVRQVRKWLRIYRTEGLEALCTLHHQGDPGKLRPAQLERLKAEIATGRFLAAQQICDWIAETFHVTYTPRGVRDLLHRIGVSYHKTAGFFWKANPTKQEEFIGTYERHKREADGPKTRRYFVDACHPVWGVEMLYCCWLLVGQRFLVGVGGGRKRLNILGAYCPEDHEYLDLRVTRDNINGQQFVNLLRLLRASHPEAEKLILYLDNAKYYHAAVVREWLARHPEFHLEFLPAYSPNLNLIERLWKFLRKKAFTRWHKSFEGMEAAVSAVLDHLEEYRAELATLMTEKFQRHPKAKAVTGQSVAA
ncbi:MAG TPA: IS630 family transposase [Isosphaeraceae bacterium]|nr:IS630 family transposase [Isosphaeraceae bacterium]